MDPSTKRGRKNQLPCKPLHNKEAEMALLGSIILNNSRLFKVLEVVHPEDFYFEENRKIFQALLKLHEQNKPIDLVTLASYFHEKGELGEIGGARYLASLVETAITAPNVTYYARIIKEKAVQRQALVKSLELANFLQKPVPVADIRAEIQKRIDNISELLKDETEEEMPLLSFNPYQEEIEEEIKLILDWPFPVPEGVLGLIAGQGEAGKSFMALYICLQAAAMGVSCLYVATEDPAPMIKKRLKYLSRHLNLLEYQDEITRNFHFMPIKSPEPIFDTQTQEISPFGQKLKNRLKSAIRGQAKLVIVDPIAALLTNENNNSEVARFMAFFRRIIEECQNKPTILIAHHLNKLGREGDIQVNNVRGASAFTDNARWVVEVRRLSWFANPKRPDLQEKFREICCKADIPPHRSYAREWLLVENSKNNYLPRFPLTLIHLFIKDGDIEVKILDDEFELLDLGANENDDENKF